jgi:hypothetical protein
LFALQTRKGLLAVPLRPTIDSGETSVGKFDIEIAFQHLSRIRNMLSAPRSFYPRPSDRPFTKFEGSAFEALASEWGQMKRLGYDIPITNISYEIKNKLERVEREISVESEKVRLLRGVY